MSAADSPPNPSPAASQQDFAAALAGSGEIAGVHDGAGRPAADRLGVYRNNVIVSLRDALRTTFAATQRLAGEEFFDAAAVAYAQGHKPASPLIFHYGATFADFLAQLPGLAQYPFVPEVARLEYGRVQAYHAADAPPLPPDALAALAPEALGGTVVRPHPATTLIDTPNGGLAAWQANQDPPLTQTPVPSALVTRPQMDVLVFALDAPTAAFTAALCRGVPLGEAAQVDELQLGEALALLLRAGAFTALNAPPS